MPFLLAININVTNQLHLYQGYTLVDITPTGQTVHSVEKEIERNQQRNWETTLQILSLRTQPNIVKTDIIVDDVKNYQFGISYTGVHKIWTFVVGVDYKDIYTKGPDIFGLLRSDFKLTPVITGLTETTDFPQPIFYSSGPDNNIYFKSLV